MNKLFFHKGISLILCISFVILFASCDSNEAADTSKNDKISVVATLFPQYDFARTIAGEHANVHLLLDPGVESHSYDPTVKDIETISNCDIFLYTGDSMEPWVPKLLSGIETDKIIPDDLSKGVKLVKHIHDEDESEHHDEHEGEYDPHIWLDMKNSVIMVNSIKEALIKRDPINKSDYQTNAEILTDKLNTLDKEFTDTVKGGKRNKIVFGGRFSYAYFVEAYEIEYETVYDTCSTDVEPSSKKIKEVIEYIKANNIPCIFYDELIEPTVAKTIAAETNIKLLTLCTGHNLTKDEFESGVTFTDIMDENLRNLKEGLK